MNRRRHANAIPIASIATGIVLLVFGGGAGFGYVYLKNDIHRTGATIKTLERELSELTTQDEVVRAKIASLSSRVALQRRLDTGFIKLVPITDDRLVRVESAPVSAIEKLRPVANERSVP